MNKPPPAPMVHPSTTEGLVREMRDEMRQRFADQADMIMETRQESREAIAELKDDLAELSGRVIRNSSHVKSASQNDMRQDAALASVITDVAALKQTQEEQLSILKRLDAVAGNPMVRRVAYAIGGAILAYLAARGHQ